jgi:hypothetical protein
LGSHSLALLAPEYGLKLCHNAMEHSSPHRDIADIFLSDFQVGFVRFAAWVLVASQGLGCLTRPGGE